MAKSERAKPVRQNTISKVLINISPNEQILEEYGIEYLFHMTHIKNLENILKHGILSKNSIEKDGFEYTNIADSAVNDIRSQKRDPYNNRPIHDYVPLYFNPRNPMLYRKYCENIQNDILILGIDRKLLLNNTTLFTDGNVASRRTIYYDNLRWLGHLNWYCIRRAKRWNNIRDGKRIICSEALIHPKIDVNSIVAIFTNNSLTKELVDFQVDGKTEIDVIQSDDYFF